jgi:4-hydroxyproline epimerase
MAARRDHFRRHLDHLRRGILAEPRGSEVLVGAVVTEPVNPGSAAGVIFFNNAGYLGMCGHGTIGLVETLRHLGKLEGSEVDLDTPVGTIHASVTDDGIAVRNVPARRTKAGATFYEPGPGHVKGDVAYGGNWFFLVSEPKPALDLAKATDLAATCVAIRDALRRHRITGDAGAEIDHVELYGPATVEGADSKNFVLCPGGAYDRSPCGTGTSAKLACLVSDGLLAPGEWYVQESITGSTFRAKIDLVDGLMVPTVVGRASVTAESTLLFDPNDPFRWGIG